MTITRSVLLLACAAVLAGCLTVTANAQAAPAPKPQIQVDDPWVPEKNSGTSTMTFHVRLSEAAGAPVTVKVATADGSATTPQDYAKVPATTLTFAPGETEKAVPVTLVGDTLREGNETLKLNVSKPSANAILSDTSGQGTIYDVEAPRRISVSDFYVIEPDDGEETWVGFDVTLDPAPAAGEAGAGVDYTLVPGTAGLGSDWDTTPLSGFVNLDDESHGQVQVVVRVVGDTQSEIDENLTIKLSNPSGAELVDNLGVGTIANDDDAAPTAAPLHISVSDARVVEGNSGSVQAPFKVSLDAPATAPVSVKVVTGGGTAQPANAHIARDYTPLASQTITFTPGQQTRTVNVAVVGDTLHEGNETFQLKLSNPVGAALADTAGVATIVDNEGPIVGYLMDAWATEGDPGAPGEGMVFHLRLSAPPPSSFDNDLLGVTWATQDGTAVAPTDYRTWTGQTTFTPGEPSWSWSAGMPADDLDEPDEQYSFVLSKPIGFVLGDAKAIGTIIDND